jgi:hypothetical protein
MIRMCSGIPYVDRNVPKPRFERGLLTPAERARAYHPAFDAVNATSWHILVMKAQNSRDVMLEGFETLMVVLRGVDYAV